MNLELPDGRTLEVLVGGSSGRLLIFHYGTPSGAVPFTPLFEAARARGLRIVVYSRPGYASSTAKPGRSVADVAADVTSILAALGANEFLTVGWSGGGPHALACATLLANRCVAAATIASVAPYNADELDWLAGMGPENIEEFGAAAQGESALTSFLEAAAVTLANVQGRDVAAALGGLASDVDKAALTDDFAEFTAATFRAGVSRGIAGWRDDDLAFVRDWGFNLASVRRPIAVWQGGQDRMVPYAHGVWLADHIPGAHAHLEAEEGHLSLAVGSLNRILDDLLDIAA
jgi:pimeloyl-ACP methyl ester carboxylesterase